MGGMGREMGGSCKRKGIYIYLRLMPQDWKRSVFIQIPIILSQRKAMQNNAQTNYHTIALISHASKVMLKNLQARFQQYVNHDFPDVQAGFRKGRGTKVKLPTSTGSWKK